MRDYEDELSAFEEEAEDMYDDYDEYEDDFDTGLEGYEYEDSYDDDYEEEEVEYLSGYEDDYDSYQSTSIGQIDPNDRTLTVVVKNTSGADAEAVIFGANEEAPQPAGVTVTVEESSHKEVREESKSFPFKLAGMKMSVSNPLQFDNVLKITRRTATGSNTIRVYQPRNATSPQNFAQTLIDDFNFEMDVTGQDSLRLTVKDGVTVVFTFTIKARANLGNLLKGNNVAELSRAPRTTGLPQIDLTRKKTVAPRPIRKVKKVIRRRPVAKVKPKPRPKPALRRPIRKRR
ncbi:hypothetical protein GCM10009122_23130 [Fulvivirga kasyanovii]|uniref:Uncharacterized protein n=1 Tax=Fulvivirga kasyanovii TaxID=396812 RepID=A0ABW9RY66_9BACT|nr:hypothetical protein [Fulvivirga kasyanovii]MTI28981.1 hypothetical protein [Fulvivirga kasyanovii]